VCFIENDEDVEGAGTGGDLATRLARDMEALAINSYCTPQRSQQVKGVIKWWYCRHITIF